MGLAGVSHKRFQQMPDLPKAAGPLPVRSPVIPPACVALQLSVKAVWCGVELGILRTKVAISTKHRPLFSIRGTRSL